MGLRPGVRRPERPPHLYRGRHRHGRFELGDIDAHRCDPAWLSDSGHSAACTADGQLRLPERWDGDEDPLRLPEAVQGRSRERPVWSAGFTYSQAAGGYADNPATS